MKMAFELNDLKGLLFLVLFTIPSTTSTNYDCKGKSFYCLDSTHFLICVDFGSGVLSTIDDFVLPCPASTECHESNTYECELPKITTTTVYATSVTEKIDNSVVPLMKTATTVTPELTTVLVSTEKSTVVPVSEAVTSESNKEVLESLKDQFVGGNEHFFEPTKFIPADKIGLSANVDNVNKTNTTYVKSNSPTVNVEYSSENKVNNSVKGAPTIIDVTTSSEGLLVTDSTTKFANIIHTSTHNIQLNITANEPTKSKILTSDSENPSTLPPNLTTDGVNVISISETSDVTSSINTVTTVPLEVLSVLPSAETNTVTIVPLEVLSVFPSPETNTVTTVPLEVTTLQPSTEKNTVIPALELVSLESNKELLEKLKDEFTEGNEKKSEHASVVPLSSIHFSPSVDKVNKISTTVNKILNSKPGTETSTVNNMEITVRENSKNIDVTATHNSNNIKILNEFTESNNMTGDEVLAKSLPTSSLNLNIGIIGLSEMSNKNIMSPINTETTVPLKATTVSPPTEKNTVIPTLQAVTSKSNKEILESLKNKFTEGNEKVFEPTKFKPTPIIKSNPKVDKVNDSSAIVDKKSYFKPDVEATTENIMKIVVTDGQKNIEVITSVDGLQATDFESANFIRNSSNIVHNTNNKELNITVGALTESENLISYEAGVKILPILSSSLNTHDVNVISISTTSYNNVVPIEVTTVLPSTDKNTFTPVLEVTTTKLNKEILESVKDEFTGGDEKIFKPTTSIPLSLNSNLDVKKLNEFNITTDKKNNAEESMESSTERIEKISVTNVPKTIDFGTAVEGIVITDLKNASYVQKLQSMSHTILDNEDFNKNNLTTPIMSNEVTLAFDPSVLTEINNENLNTNNITDNVGRNLVPEEQKDFLSNQLVQKLTTLTPFQISSTVTTSNPLQTKEPDSTEPLIYNNKTSDALNDASVSINKYETINNIEAVHPTFSNRTNIAVNATEQNLDVLNNNEKNGVNTNINTPPNNENTTEVTLTTHTETTPTETQLFVSADNSFTTPITDHESIRTTVSSTTIENSITPRVNSVTTTNIYVNKNEPNVLKVRDIKEAPIDIQVKSTTTTSVKNLIDVTSSPQLAVTTSAHSSNVKDSFPKKLINITTSDTIYTTASSITTLQSKTDETKTVEVNNLDLTTTENGNTKPNNINGSEGWDNTDFMRPNMSSLATKKLYSPNEESNIPLNYEIVFQSALESAITTTSTTEPNAVIKDQIKRVDQNNITDANSLTISSTLSSTHKSNMITEAMYTTSYTIHENVEYKSTEAPSKLETVTNAETISQGVTLSLNVNNIKTNDININWTEIKNAAPPVIHTKNTAPESTSVYIKEHKVGQLDTFSTTVNPIIVEPITSENILKVIKFQPSEVTENPLHSTTEVTKSDYVKIITEVNIPYPKAVIQTGYSKPDYITSTSNTNIETATSGAGISSETSTMNKISSSNVKDADIENFSTLKSVTVPMSREILHSETTVQLPLEITKTQTVYYSNTLVPRVAGFTAEQKPNIADIIPLTVMASKGKSNIDKSSKISTEQASESIVINNNEPISMVEKSNMQKSKSIFGSAVNYDTAINSTYSTNLKIRDEYNTTRIKEALQTNTQNISFANKISANTSNKEDMNLKTTANALEKTLLYVDIGGKSKIENDDEDNDSTRPYGSASRIELTTPNPLDYKNNKPVINTSYVTPPNGKSQTYNINIHDTQTNKKDNETKTIPAKTKAPIATIHGNEGKVNNPIPNFDCQNKTRGKYGDSKDCQKFYTCIGTLQPIVGICPNHTVFSEINKQCTRNLSHCVRNNQFHCLYEGRFSDFFKDNVYYICVNNNFHGFIRYTLQCQGGYYLNKAIVRCVKNLEIHEYKESVSSISENSKLSNDQDKSVIKSDESEKSVSNDFECNKEGSFPYSNDCRMYYVCSKNSKDEYRRKIKKCSTDEVYDKEKKKCVYADSIEC